MRRLKRDTTLRPQSHVKIFPDSPAPALDRGLAILELLAESQEGLSFSRLAAELATNATTLSRLLKVLQAREYIRKDSVTGLYRIAARLALFAQNTPVNRVLLEEGHEILASLSQELGMTTLLIRFVSDRMVALDKVTHPDNVAMQPVGNITRDFAAYPWGWLQLMRMREDGSEEVFGEEALPRELATLIREESAAFPRKGYMDDYGRINPGMRRLAAPIYEGTGRLVAALAVGCMSSLLPDERVGEVAAALCAAARRLSAALGYRG